MILINVRDDQVDQAKHMASDMGIIRNSIMNGSGNVAGFLGEIVIADYFGFIHKNSYDYDLITEDNRTIDVKTKQTTVAPRNYYDCSVAAYNTRQNCDYYCFTRVSKEFDRLWFLGMIEKERYFSLARFLRQGDQDGDNGFIVRADCYNLTINEIWEETKRIVT